MPSPLTEPLGNAPGALTGKHAGEALRRHRKIPLGMPVEQRQALLDVLLDIHRIAMASFDAIDTDLVSEHDVLVMAQLPDRVNTFTRAMESHARKRIGETDG